MQISERISYQTLSTVLKKLPTVTNTLIIKPDTPAEALYEAIQLLTFVSDQRAEDIDSWRTIGRLLYKLSNKTINGLDAWIAFSKRASVFTEEDCCTYWITIKKPIESIHILFSYIQEDEDHMESYLIYKNTNGKLRLMKLMNTELYEEDVAGVMYMLYKDEFLYYNGSWYKCKDTQWNSIKESIELRSRIPKLSTFFDDVLKKNRDELETAENKYRDVEDNMDADPDWEDDEETQTMKEEKKKQVLGELRKEINKILAIREKILSIRTKLKKIAYKNGIMSECKDIFYDTLGILDSYVTEEKISHNVTNKDIMLYGQTKIYDKNILYNKNTVRSYSNYIDDIITKQLQDKWRVSDTYKRISEIINYFQLKKDKNISKKVKEYFIKNGVTIEEDRSNGHKIYIEY